MKSLANTTAMIAPITMPATWKRNWIVRLVPRRQPVERSCCMSQASLVDTSSTVAGHQADDRIVQAERRPSGPR